MVDHVENQGLGLLHALRYVGTARIKGPPDLSQGDSPGRPVQQARSQAILQLANLATDRRRGQSQIPRSRGKPAVFNDGGEHDHLCRYID